jgi:hypothetical protein
MRLSFHDLHEVREPGDPEDLPVVLGQADGPDRLAVAPARRPAAGPTSAIPVLLM